ncbi:penicillin-binding protein 2 [Bacillus sp. EB600]|uniref:peptidoglycan D,D-transpeptidase FtsI family protein n=1 Tax=Bacillus sp. EB600 TaxID=2806345 RepID=UPI00210AE376|nr:penicillin-binding protein 2 [Bacillus sp. EB600]
MIFFLVFCLFSLLILRLGVVQIVYGDDYKREVQRTVDVTVNSPVPRGKMYDRNGKVIVDNTPLNAITYTKKQNADPQETLKTAENLSKLIDMNTSNPMDPDYLKKTVSVRDQKDFWLVKYPEKAQALIKKSELKKLDAKQLYNLQLKRITDKDLSSLNLNTVAIFSKMNSGYTLNSQIIKNQNVTPQEYAEVSENLANLPGVDTTTDWARSYAYGNTLQTILGNVSSSQQGIPKDELEKYLAQGYSRNDRVGTSYLEQEYEDVLQGQKAKLQSKTDKSGNILSTETVSDGQRGDDLVLTIDMDLQQQVEQIIENGLWKLKQNPASRLADRVFVVLMDPHTGEILTMAGKQIVNNPQTGKPEMKDFALGNITTSYNVGSAVKGATVLTGYETGAIQPGQVLVDEPLNIKGTPLEKSWKTFGPINDLRALQVSSNVYMWKTVIAMAGGQYAPGQGLKLNMNTFDTIRQSFAQFGLGKVTGIDLPNETAGFKGTERIPGKLMYLGIGQYDTYTTIQLAQYVSTIANGGYRVQPHIVKEIREPSTDNKELGPIIEQVPTKILDKINAQDSWIQRVQQGFKMVMQVGDGTAVKYFGSADYDPAGKTGTAQAFYDGPLRKQFGKNDPEVMNLSLVAFAPASNPEIAMAVLVPWAYEGATGPSPNEEIGRQVLDAYFNLKKQRQQVGQMNPTAGQTVQNADPNQVVQKNSPQG